MTPSRLLLLLVVPLVSFVDGLHHPTTMLIIVIVITGEKPENNDSKNKCRPEIDGIHQMPGMI